VFGTHVALVWLGFGLCGNPLAGLFTPYSHPDPLELPERTLSDLWWKIDAIGADLFLRSDAILDHAFDAGFAEPVREDLGGGCALGMDLSRQREEAWRRSTIFARRIVRGMEVQVVLDRFDFPELYVLKDASVRLRGLVEEILRRQRAEAWRVATR
jgi:hypothetical protein